MEQVEIRNDTSSSGKFKRILSFYGLIYILILFLIVGLGTLYVKKLGYIAENEIVPVTISSDSLKKQGDLLFVKGDTTPPLDVTKLSTPTEELIEKGKTLYEANCTACHGTGGKGDGPAGLTLEPPPRNFQDLNGWKNGPKISQIYLTLEQGIIENGMPQYNNLFPGDRFALIHFIRRFNDDYPVDNPEELKSLDENYSLSSGSIQPGQIPIKTAIEKLAQEYFPVYEKIINLTSHIDNSNKEEGAEIFKRMSYDLSRSLVSLTSNTIWNDSENSFVNFVITEPNQKGFRASVNDLTSEEWSSVYLYLKSLFES
jgi:hypothetical protein